MNQYDYIVIGAGSAGAIVASRLAEDPDVTVLLLEAGPSDRTPLVRKFGMMTFLSFTPNHKREWGFKTAPQRHMNNRCVTYTRGKTLGGCSSVNGMLYIRGHKENYNQWAASGCEGWSYDDILPLYKKLEDHEDGESEHHGAGGPIKITRHPYDQLSPVSKAFMEAASEVCGVPILDDVNGAEQNCVGTFPMSASNGVRYGTGEAYIQPSLSKPNFHLQMNKLVHRIVIENGRATGVEYGPPGSRTIAGAGREVILSAGAIGTPQLLMLSGVGPADHLREYGIDVVMDLPGVGKNLHDHLLVPVIFRAPTSLHRSMPDHILAGMIKEYTVGNTWFGRTMFEACAFIKSHPEAPLPDIQFHTLPWGYFDPNRDGNERFNLDKGRCLTVMPTLLYPKSRGEVLLTSNNPAAKPNINPNYLEAPEDLDLLVNGVRLTRKICAHPALKEHLKTELAPGAHRASTGELVAEVKLRAQTVYHPVGTCKMGVDEMAVVDPKLRVRGIEGLRVADASIIPEITGGNTNAPCMMIGEHAACLIKGQAMGN